MSDHIVDANKMVETPRTDAVMDHRVKLWDAINRYVSSCCGNPSRNVYGNTRRQQCVSEIESLVYSGLKRELAATNEQMSLQARQLLEVVNDRNRLGVQLDLIRDELQRIWARVMESGHADHPSLSWIKVYCERAQKDIAVNYTPIQERDKLSRDVAAANARIAELEAVVNDPQALWANWLRGTVALPSGIGDVRQYQERVAELISQRDTARMQAECNYKLREEFVGLLGTEDIERGVEVVRALKSKVDYLQHWITRLATIHKNHSKHRIWADGFGWLEKGKCAYVGPQKPWDLR